LAGFEEDLGLKGQDFATVLSIVYVGYILMQVPSNMILGKIKYPSWYMSGAMLLWGMIVSDRTSDRDSYDDAGVLILTSSVIPV
jgi:hypothetical protein